MTDMPPRIWAKRVPVTVVCDGEWWDRDTDELSGDETEYIRADKIERMRAALGEVIRFVESLDDQRTAVENGTDGVARDVCAVMDRARAALSE